MSIRTVDNARDVNRKIPTTAIAPRVLLETEGVFHEKVTGPGASATIELSYPAVAISHVFAYVTATGAWALVPNPIPGTDYTAVLKNTNGKLAITEAAAADRSAETWLVMYHREMAEGNIGGQSSVISTDI